MSTMEDYDKFLQSKVRLAQKNGFDLDIGLINQNLKPHNKIMVKWLVEELEEKLRG